MIEAKEAFIREDESEGDDTEELYQSAFTKTEGTCPLICKHNGILPLFD